MVTDKIPLNQRLETAQQLRRQGFNCAQCVMAAFPDVHGLTDLAALKLSCGLGGGVGGLKQTCGVVSTMAMLEGCRYDGKPQDKAEAYRTVQQLAEEFESAVGCQSTLCAVLKSDACRVPCDKLILTGIEIFHNHVAK